MRVRILQCLDIRLYNTVISPPPLNFALKVASAMFFFIKIFIDPTLCFYPNPLSLNPLSANIIPYPPT